MSDTEIKMKEISNRITDLKIEYEKLRGNHIEELQDKLNKLVGMSFKDQYNDYFRIIDVPHVEYNKSYTLFNEYQIPILACYKDPAFKTVDRIAIVTRTSKASHAEDPVECIRNEYTEIPAEEFDAELEKVFDEIRALGRQGDAE